MDGRWQRLGSVGERAIVFTLVLVLLACGGAVLSAEEVKPRKPGALPVLVFQTDEKAVQDRTRVPASLTVLLPEDGGSRFSIDETASGPAELSVRGNSSFNFPKKSYRLELQDDSGKDRKARLLQLPADSDWVLYASGTDMTFCRNVLAHELWRNMGHYAVRWRFVEVFVLTNSSQSGRLERDQLTSKVPGVLRQMTETNLAPTVEKFTEEDFSLPHRLKEGYDGLYLLMEKIKRSKERVDIARLRPQHDREPELSGGYIVKRDDKTEGERGLLTGQEVMVRFEEPKERELTGIQRAWIWTYFEQIEKALFGAEFRNSETGYARYLDVESFIDFHWLVEMARNADGYFMSQYMHKDRGGKLSMGPIWDWDNTFGNPSFAAAQKTNEWKFEGAVDPDYTWYRRLFEDPDFLQSYIDRWSQLRTNVFSTDQLMRIVETTTNQVFSAFVRNDVRWGAQLTGDHHRQLFQKSVGWLKQWVACRLAWIDAQDYPKPVLQAVYSTNGTSISMANLDGRLFFTTNGSDPRVPGGAVAPVAFEYSKPVEVAGQMTIKARARSKYGLWSAPVELSVQPHSAAAASRESEGR